MSEITSYNPYKIRDSHRRTDDHTKATEEMLKRDAPELYKRLQHEEASIRAQIPFINSMLDDPLMVAKLDRLMASRTSSKLSTELALLGVEATATKRDVRNAYRRQARKLHPDKGGNAQAFQRMHEAYRQVLANAKA